MKHIQPATTARNPNESAWDTIRSSSRLQQPRRTHQLQSAFNLHHHRRTILHPPQPLHLSHRPPLLLRRPSRFQTQPCRAPTLQPSIPRPHLTQVQLIHHYGALILLREATTRRRVLQTPHRDLLRLRFRASITNCEVLTRHRADLNRQFILKLLTHLPQLSLRRSKRARGRIPESSSNRSISSTLRNPEVGGTLLSLDPRRASLLTRV